MNKHTSNKLALALLLSLLPALPARAAEVGGMFRQGQASFQIEFGSGTAYNNNYTIFGVGASYYVVDGLALGLAYDNWSGSTPGINQITPSVQYVFLDVPRVKPYIGAFYRHSSVSGQPAFNSAGARAGVYIHSGSHSAVGIGLVSEKYLSCQTAFGSCSQTYPEISIIFAF